MARVRFRPPFAASSGQYHGITYPGHSSWAVDFNRGSGWTDEGDPALCSLDGTVSAIISSYGGVRVRHPFGYETWYYHLRDIALVVGQEVATGQLVGLISNTYPAPRILSPHLHYEQRRFGSRIRITFDTVAYPGSRDHVDAVLYGPLIAGQ